MTESKQHTGVVINLCRDLTYLSSGYYVSLLAQARGQRVLPSVSTINDLANIEQYQLSLKDMSKQCQRYIANQQRAQAQSITVLVCFGKCEAPELQALARDLFDTYPCPILKVQFKFEGRWFLHTIQQPSLPDLTDEEQSFFAETLEGFSKKIWRSSRTKKDYRYDLAILHDPNESIPTSDKKALKKFVQIAKEFDIEAELITQDDYARLLEFDALFIRETTKINHHTYHFAKKAQANGLVVIDHPDAILRCANKVFLHELLTKNNIAQPKSALLLKSEPIDYRQLANTFGFPLVLKIPDGSFSIGVEKVNSLEELQLKTKQLFQTSSILLAQEWLPTSFDWRIGVLNHRAIYACKYYMARGHWQIYNHQEKGKHKSGSFECFGVHQVPKEVIKLALKSTKLIGDGLYGVDIKETAQGPVVIEINDNPSIESGVEDQYLGDELYRIVLADFERRLEN